MGNLHRRSFVPPPGDAVALEQPVWVVDADRGFRAEVAAHFSASGLYSQGYADAAALFKGLRQIRPGCIILDMNLPDMHGLEVQRMLAAQFSCIPLIFVSSEVSVPTVTQAIRFGACDFVLKPVDLCQLLGQTQAMLEAVRRLDPQEMRRETIRRRLRTLTARESHILMFALTGKSNKEISLELGISHRTVETHRTHILQKLGVANLLELAHILSDVRDLAPAPRALNAAGADSASS
jgi:FixJ family two-component response regulator